MKLGLKSGERQLSRMEMLAEQISRVEAAELGGQEFQLAVLSALLQVILAILLLMPVLAILYIISCLEGVV